MNGKVEAAALDNHLSFTPTTPSLLSTNSRISFFLSTVPKDHVVSWERGNLRLQGIRLVLVTDNYIYDHLRRTIKPEHSSVLFVFP